MSSETSMQLETIVLATDFSDEARQAQRSAADLARRTGARLHLLHALVVETPYVLPLDSATLFPSHARLVDEMEEHGRRELESAVALLEPRPANLETALVRGESTVEVVLDYANEKGADLLVMASHGRRGFRRFLLGSVTEEVLRRASCPVLVVRRSEQLRTPEEAGSARVLCAVDLSHHSALVVSAAQSMAAIFDAELDLVHVDRISIAPAAAYATAPAPATPPIVTADRETTERSLDQLSDALRSATGPEVPTRVEALEGDPVSEIVGYAESKKAGLIVAGTAGHSGVGRLVLGSVCEGLARRAPCPVLVVPTE